MRPGYWVARRAAILRQILCSPIPNRISLPNHIQVVDSFKSFPPNPACLIILLGVGVKRYIGSVIHCLGALTDNQVGNGVQKVRYT